jgi:hypothetical protein
MKILVPLFALAMLQVGCGGDDSSIASDDSGSADGTTDDGSTTSESGSDAGLPVDAAADGALDGGDAGADAATDAATDAASDGAVDGGVVPNPGSVSCGAASCVVPAFCCAQPADGGLTCQTGGGCAGGVQRECDEAADCPAAQVCCYENTAGGLTSACHTDCAGGGGTRTQACRLASECLSGTCAVHACSDGGTASVETCAPISGLCP